MTQAKTPGLLFGDDPETIAANRNYQEALRKLTESIDTRKNRLFDPQLMAITRGFLEPGAPDFFESLGRVAKNLGEVQTAQEKENRDIAQLEFDLAGRGLEMQRQKSRQAMANRFLQEEQTGALPGGQAGPSGQRGFQIAPPDPKRLTGRQYLQMALAEGMPFAEALQKAEVIDRENIQAKESGIFNIREGRFFPTQYKEVPFQINGKTYNIPEGTALELSHLARIGDVEGFNRESRKAIRDFGQSAAAPQAVQQTSPQLAAQAAAPQSGAAAATSVQPPAAAGSPVGQVQERIRQIAGDQLGGLTTGPAQAAGTAAAPSAVAARVPTPQGGAQAAQGLPAAATSAAAARVPTPQAAAALPQAAPPVVPQAAPSAAARPATAVAPPAAAVAPVAAAAQGQTAAAGAAPSFGLRSKEDIEAEQRRIQLEQKRAEALQTAEVESEIKNRSEITDAAKKAREITATANILRRFSDNPNFSKMTGILNNEKISSGLAMLVRDGVGGKSISIGLPAIEDVMRNARLTPAEQAQYRTFLMYTAQMNLAAENSMKGSTTERERLILGNATISNQDTRETVRTKADLLNLKAQFDKRVANAFEDSKMTPKEFFRSDRFNTMYSSYLENLEEVAIGAKMLPTRAGAQPGAQRQGAQTAPAQGGNTSNAAAGSRLRGLVNGQQQRRP
jgi:hypothetical protein